MRRFVLRTMSGSGDAGCRGEGGEEKGSEQNGVLTMKPLKTGEEGKRGGESKDRRVKKKKKRREPDTMNGITRDEKQLSRGKEGGKLY